jgi:hypothetical protein
MVNSISVTGIGCIGDSQLATHKFSSFPHATQTEVSGRPPSAGLFGSMPFLVRARCGCIGRLRTGPPKTALSANGERPLSISG